MTEYTIGTDISKSHLDAFHLEDETARRSENSPRGFRARAFGLDYPFTKIKDLPR